MTIRRRLLISHLTMFAVPILMTAVVFLSAIAGMLVFIRSGNHVYIEGGDQFSHASEIMYYHIFHNARRTEDIEDPSRYDGLIGVLDPGSNFVLLETEGRPVFRYGNEGLLPLFAGMPPKEELRELHREDRGMYTRMRGNEFITVRKRTVDGRAYYLSYASRLAPHGTDERLEVVTRGTLRFILIALVLFIAGSSWFLSRFMLRHLLPPLEALEAGAKEIRSGNLDISLSHKGRDEFTPVFDAFNVMAAELSESLRQKKEEEQNRKELIAAISHDLRTPLTAIKAYVEGLTDGVADTEERRARYLHVIQKKTGELDSLVNQLFLLSKMDVGNRAVPLERTDLSDFITLLIEDNQGNLSRRGMSVSFTPVPGCAIDANPQLLERLILNLWENSTKYRTEERGEITMTISQTETETTLTVTDDGPGVAETALPHLFEAFYRTDKARSRTGDGSGLGLAIAARAMECMHGKIHAENAKPHGLAVVMEWKTMRNS